MSEDTLMPVPIETEAWIVIVTNPVASATLAGLPAGVAMFVLTSHGINPLAVTVPASAGAGQIPPVLYGLAAWLAVFVTVLVWLSRPY